MDTMISRNDPCWCGSGKKWKKCHYPEKSPDTFTKRAAQYKKQYGIVLKTPEQLKGIRKACKFSAGVLKELCAMAKGGVTTNQLNDRSAELHKAIGAIPAALHYGEPPFPKGICTSLNEVVCHGIPDDRPLIEGDIMNIDVASIVDGFFGDCSAMVVIGKTSEEKQKVVDVAHECMMRGIRTLKPGVQLCEIGAAIEDYALEMGCSVVNQFVSHGVGLEFHEQPQLPHHYNSIGTPLAEGMTFTVEPMINAGKRGCVIDTDDMWTARTIDNRPTAQWEHTVYITADGHEILTQLP
jgi:methionyl aminopeptidase